MTVAPDELCISVDVKEQLSAVILVYATSVV